jgi:hypothetical protein
MLAYGVVSISLLALSLIYFLYVVLKDHPAALLFDVPIVCAVIYIGTFFVASAPLALGIVSIVLLSIETLVFLILLAAGIYENEGDMIMVGFLNASVCINAIVFLGCAL